MVHYTHTGESPKSKLLGWHLNTAFTVHCWQLCRWDYRWAQADCNPRELWTVHCSRWQGYSIGRRQQTTRDQAQMDTATLPGAISRGQKLNPQQPILRIQTQNPRKKQSVIYYCACPVNCVVSYYFFEYTEVSGSARSYISNYPRGLSSWLFSFSGYARLAILIVMEEGSVSEEVIRMRRRINLGEYSLSNVSSLIEV